jgi:hypothetical protein
MSSGSSSSEHGPASTIKLAATSRWGPFAAGSVVLKPTEALVRNETDRPFVVASAVVSPLIDERNGLPAGVGALAAKVAPGVLPPGGSVEATISGAAPARPGGYQAHLDLLGESGAPISTGIQVNVSASPFWGIVCMLFGLTLLGLLNLLKTEGDIENLTGQVLLERSAVHLAWVNDPPPLSRAETVARIDRDFDEAVRTLASSRAFSVDDRRLSEASTSLAAAREADGELRQMMAKYPPGTAETAELEQDWDALRAVVSGLAAPIAPGEPKSEGQTAQVAEALGRVQAQFLGPPALAAAASIDAQIRHIRLLLAAGQIELARRMALATRTSMAVAAADLEKRLALQMSLTLTADSTARSEARLRLLASDETWPPEARAKWTARLDAVDAKLAHMTTLKDFTDAASEVKDAEIQSMRDQEGALLARVGEATQAASKELSLEAVGAAFAKMGPPGSLSAADYYADMAKVFEAWRASLVPSTDEVSRRTIEKTADAGIDAAKRQDKAGIKQAYEALKDEWRDYTTKHVSGSVAAAVGPVCHDWQDLEIQQLAAVHGVVNLQPATEEVVNLERQLDRTRLKLEAVEPNSPECIAQVQQATLDLSAVTEQAERLSTTIEPSELTLTTQTDEGDMVKDKPITFILKPPYPNWRSDTDLTVNWGDGQTSQIPATRMGPAERLEHVYRRIGTFHPSVTADQGRVTGTSQSDVFVKSSPATRIQRAGDIFLNLQFALALLIASVVYFWRFHSGTVTFGAESVHYVQAFTLGFAAYAAVAVLPNVLAELPFH